MKKLHYKGKELAVLTDDELQQILNHTGSILNFREQRLISRYVEIIDGEEGTSAERMTSHGDEVLARSKYINLWKKEQEKNASETPEEKTFRNYRCVFCWRYLLRYGFSEFFGSDDWRRQEPSYIFSKFDNEIWKRDPSLMRRFCAASENYFSENPEQKWLSEDILQQFLP